MSDAFVGAGVVSRRRGMARLAVSVFVLAVAAQVAAVSAQTTAPTLTKTVVVAGDSVGVTGSGCAASTQVQVQLDSVTRVTATSAAGGTYTTTFVVPKSVTPGPHPVTVVCTGPDGTVTTSATLTVSATATTGYAPGTPIVVGAVLLMVGAIAFLATRRRRLRPALVRSP